MILIKVISCDEDDFINRLQFCVFVYVGLQLRDFVSRFSRVIVDKIVVGEFSEFCRKYFNVSVMFLNNVIFIVWIIGYVVLYYVGLFYKMFFLGLGINKGREAKYVRIFQYVKYVILSIRCRFVMRYDYVIAVWLRKFEFFKLFYYKCIDVYV